MVFRKDRAAAATRKVSTDEGGESEEELSPWSPKDPDLEPLAELEK